MKVVCAWCGKIIKDGEDGPEAPVSHGICPDCAPLLTEPEEDGPPPADDFCGQVSWWITCLVAGSLIINLCLLAAVLIAEVLHWLTGGAIPRLVDW